ncbi:MAG: hypothetical protein V3V82_07775 [Acidimicrobiia bacterium]
MSDRDDPTSGLPPIPGLDRYADKPKTANQAQPERPKPRRTGATARIAAGALIVAVGAALLITQTAGQPITTTTTTTLDPAVVEAELFERDSLLIRGLFSDYSDTWIAGQTAAFQFIVDNNHPDLGFGIDDYDCSGFAPSYREELIVDLDSFVPSDGWVLPSGVQGPGSRIDGEVPRGRLYALRVDWTYVEDGFDLVTESIRVHAAILGKGEFTRAYFFLAPDPCQ